MVGEGAGNRPESTEKGKSAVPPEGVPGVNSQNPMVYGVVKTTFRFCLFGRAFCVDPRGYILGRTRVLLTVTSSLTVGTIGLRRCFSSTHGCIAEYTCVLERAIFHYVEIMKVLNRCG